MCKSHITVKKFLKLLLEIEFYKIIIFLIFVITGYQSFSISSIAKVRSNPETSNPGEIVELTESVEGEVVSEEVIEDTNTSEEE